MWAAHGSSPLARGTQADRQSDPCVQRFIPARAGNTRRPAPRRRVRSVHPRSRGEHAAIQRVTGNGAGSSPLARGTLTGRALRFTIDRFIPARAGNTSARRWCATATSVHPRSRGEHPSTKSSLPAHSGSSPLARGTRHRDSQRRGPVRFIPARAGNTCVCVAAAFLIAVHPRSRGEHNQVGWHRPVADGSSPLARGTRRRRVRVRDQQRFIPARAGNTEQLAAG